MDYEQMMTFANCNAFSTTTTATTTTTTTTLKTESTPQQMTHLLGCHFSFRGRRGCHGGCRCGGCWKRITICKCHHLFIIHWLPLSIPKLFYFLYFRVFVCQWIMNKWWHLQIVTRFRQPPQPQRQPPRQPRQLRKLKRHPNKWLKAPALWHTQELSWLQHCFIA